MVILKQKKWLMILLMMPVVLTAVLSLQLARTAILTLRKNSSEVLQYHYKRLDTVVELNKINENIVRNQKLVQNALGDAVSGEVTMYELFRVHSLVVDTLAYVNKRLKSLANSELFNRVIERDLVNEMEVMKKEFSEYRRFVIMTTDIIAIDPGEAENYIIQAKNHYIQYSYHALQVASILSENTQESIDEQAELIRNLYRKILLRGLFVMLLLFTFSGFIAWKLNKYVVDLFEKAKNASQAKSDFLATMSHEIRTPINGVIGFTELLKETTLNDIQKQYIEYVDVSAKSLLDVINDILDLSKIESGKLDLDIVRADIIELTERAIDAVNWLATKKGLEVILNIEPGIPRYFEIDPLRLRQVLYNFLSNAVKFTETGEVELKLSFKKKDQNTCEIFFSVRDTGIGISTDQKNRIFKAFSQAESSINRRFGGTGLGLVIAKNLVEKMGGEINFTSEYGKGSIFHFSITAKYEEDVLKSINPKTGQEKILIVDDNPTNRLILEKRFKYLKYETLSFSDGYSLIEYLKKTEDFHLLLIDYQMPGLDGVEVIRMIRNDLGIQRDRLKIALMHNSFKKNEVFLENLNSLDIFYLAVKPLKSIDFSCIIDSSVCQESELKPEPKPQNNEVLNFGRKIRILIAEDNPINMRLTVDIVNRIFADSELFTAENGIEALKIYKENDIDIILLDIQMPLMDGLELTKRIREDEFSLNKHTPIITLTAGVVKSEFDKSLSAGADHILGKPVKIETLSAVLQKYLK